MLPYYSTFSLVNTITSDVNVIAEKSDWMAKDWTLLLYTPSLDFGVKQTASVDHHTPTYNCLYFFLNYLKQVKTIKKVTQVQFRQQRYFPRSVSLNYYEWVSQCELIRFAGYLTISGLGNKPPDKSYPEENHPEIFHPDITPPRNKPPGNKSLH